MMVIGFTCGIFVVSIVILATFFLIRRGNPSKSFEKPMVFNSRKQTSKEIVKKWDQLGTVAEKLKRLG